MKPKMTNLRHAIAMIELIFAIVIIGIVLMAAPTLISQATSSGLVALQQEAIAAAGTQIGMVLTRHWDEGDTNASLESPILITNGDAQLAEGVDADGNLTGRRAGTPLLSHRSFLTSLGTRLNATAAAAFTGDGGTDDIDDFDGVTDTLAAVSATTTVAGDYVDTSLQLQSSVSYISDAPSAGTYNSEIMSLNDPFGATAANTTNIKRVSVTVTTGDSSPEELEKNITLNAFSCNIGTHQLAGRSFP
jgi:hypothetical protein